MLNEKTLELNITTEFLNICRQYDPQSFIFGTTLRQESLFGYDSRALGNLPQHWQIAVYQYKRALRMRQTHLGPEFKFHINNNTYYDQHLLLYLMSGGKPNIALYVLPCFTTLYDVRNLSPNLLQETYFADASDIPPWYMNNRAHTLLVYPQRLLGIVLSEKREIKLTSSSEILANISDRVIGITIEELLTNLRQRYIQEAELRSYRPRFRFQIFPR